jgi:hypothetical protein
MSLKIKTTGMCIYVQTETEEMYGVKFCKFRLGDYFYPGCVSLGHLPEETRIQKMNRLWNLIGTKIDPAASMSEGPYFGKPKKKIDPIPVVVQQFGRGHRNRVLFKAKLKSNGSEIEIHKLKAGSLYDYADDKRAYKAEEIILK